MIKLMALLQRKPGMSVEDFQYYWRARHADVVVRLPGVRRYVQSHTLPGGYRKGTPIYDGVAEVWFDSTDAMRSLAGTPELAAVRADEAKFLDIANSPFIITEEPCDQGRTDSGGGCEEHWLRTEEAQHGGR